MPHLLFWQFWLVRVIFSCFIFTFFCLNVSNLFLFNLFLLFILFILLVLLVFGILIFVRGVLLNWLLNIPNIKIFKEIPNILSFLPTFHQVFLIQCFHKVGDLRLSSRNQKIFFDWFKVIEKLSDNISNFKAFFLQTIIIEIFLVVNLHRFLEFFAPNRHFQPSHVDLLSFKLFAVLFHRLVFWLVNFGCLAYQPQIVLFFNGG